MGEHEDKRKKYYKRTFLHRSLIYSSLRKMTKNALRKKLKKAFLMGNNFMNVRDILKPY